MSLKSNFERPGILFTFYLDSHQELQIGFLEKNTEFILETKHNANHFMLSNKTFHI